MNIRNINHKFAGTLRKRTRTDFIVLHHSAGNDASAETIHGWHLDRKWFGIGYHFVIRQSGAIETGRPIDTVGSHAGATANGNSIAICLLGNFDVIKPNAAQINSLIWLIKEHIYPKYGKLPLTAHKEYMSTSCPGRNFPMEQVKQLVAENDSTLLINGRKVAAKVVNKNNRLLIEVPGEDGMVLVRARELAAALGGTISWNAATKTASMRI